MRAPLFNQLWIAGFGALLTFASALSAQDISLGPKAPSVEFAPPEVLTVAPGKTGKLLLHFRVLEGFHINSNTPKSDFLIPPALKLESPAKVTIAKTIY